MPSERIQKHYCEIMKERGPAMKKMLFIINPRSGREQIRNRLLGILDTFIKAGYETEVYITQDAGDARRIVGEKGALKDMVVCSGGDGTLNEVVSGMMLLEREHRPVLGYIPSGSTNDFAASLELPKDMAEAATVAVSGTDYPTDVGRFGADQYFIYVAAFGVFTEVSYRTPQEAKNLLGHPAYMLEAVKEITSLKSCRLRVEWEDGILEDDFILGMVTNTMQIGGFKGLVGADVALNDGEFEVLLVRMPKAPKDIASIASYLIQREGENDCVSRFRARRLRITAREPVDWTLDGEYGGSWTEVEIENQRQAAVIRRKPSYMVEPVWKLTEKL